MDGEIRSAQVPFAKSTPGNKSSGDRVGLVALKIRENTCKPWCHGNESFLVRNSLKRKDLPLKELENHGWDSGH